MASTLENSASSKTGAVGISSLKKSESVIGTRRSKRKSDLFDADPNYSPDKSSTKKKPVSRTPSGIATATATAIAVSKPLSSRGKRPSLAELAKNDSPLRRSTRVRKRKVTSSSDDDGPDEAEIAADYFARQSPFNLEDGGGHTVIAPPPAAPAPRFYEMTPQLLETLMAPVGLYQSPSEDGTANELRLRMPVDFGGGCVGVCDVLFNEHLGVKVDGATDWMPVHFNGDYLDPESVQVPDGFSMDIDEIFDVLSNRQYGSQSARRSNSGARGTGSAPISTLACKEEFNAIAPILDMNSWMGKAFKKSSPSSWLAEHDYAEPTMKFGRPRSAGILQDAISAFNKYVNFIRLSERREPFLFGLWWEKEDAHADYWLLPKSREEDSDYDRRQATLVIPIANEWTEEVVVSTEETVDQSGLNGGVIPMTFWDSRGFLSMDAKDMLPDYSEEKITVPPGGFHSVDEEEAFFKNQIVSRIKRKRTTATPVVRAPRFIAPKLDPRTAMLFDGKTNESGLPENFDELINIVQSRQQVEPNFHDQAANSAAAATATGSQLKNVSKEKLAEMDFAMRCIKELQQRRHLSNSKLNCRICNREFTAPTSLIVHYRSHAGIKPFTCPICLTAFTRRHSLKYHMLCHSGQARFRCDVCDRLFRHSGHYRDHLRKHEQGMPFTCNACGRVFATRTTFRRHLAMTHGSGNPHKGRGRSVGVSKWTLDAEIEGLDDLEAGELGEVAEEIEYEAEDDDDLDSLLAEELVEGEVL